MQKEFNIKPGQFLKVTIEEIEQGDEKEYDMDNLGETLLESARGIAEAKKQGRELPDARELLESLSNVSN